MPRDLAPPSVAAGAANAGVVGGESYCIVKSCPISMSCSFFELSRSKEALDMGDQCTMLIVPEGIADVDSRMLELVDILRAEAQPLDKDHKRVWRLMADALSVMNRMSNIGFRISQMSINPTDGVHTWLLACDCARDETSAADEEEADYARREAISARRGPSSSTGSSMIDRRATINKTGGVRPLNNYHQSNNNNKAMNGTMQHHVMSRKQQPKQQQQQPKQQQQQPHQASLSFEQKQQQRRRHNGFWNGITGAGAGSGGGPNNYDDAEQPPPPRSNKQQQQQQQHVYSAYTTNPILRDKVILPPPPPAGAAAAAAGAAVDSAAYPIRGFGKRYKAMDSIEFDAPMPTSLPSSDKTPVIKSSNNTSSIASSSTTSGDGYGGNKSPKKMLIDNNNSVDILASQSTNSTITASQPPSSGYSMLSDEEEETEEQQAAAAAVAASIAAASDTTTISDKLMQLNEAEAGSDPVIASRKRPLDQTSEDSTINIISTNVRTDFIPAVIKRPESEQLVVVERIKDYLYANPHLGMTPLYQYDDDERQLGDPRCVARFLCRTRNNMSSGGGADEYACQACVVVSCTKDVPKFHVSCESIVHTCSVDWTETPMAMMPKLVPKMSAS